MQQFAFVCSRCPFHRKAGRSPTLSKTRTSVLYEMLTTKRALDGEDVAEGLSISRSTVTREWQTARASMHRRLTDARARGDS